MELKASGRSIWYMEVYGSIWQKYKKLCSRLRKGDSGKRKPGSGRPRKTTVRGDGFLMEEATRPRDAFDNCPSTADLAGSLNDRTSAEVSRRTAQRRLRERNYKKCLKTRKPFVSTVNRRKRVQCVMFLVEESWNISSNKRDINKRKISSNINSSNEAFCPTTSRR